MTSKLTKLEKKEYALKKWADAKSYDSKELAKNFEKLDPHDGTAGKAYDPGPVARPKPYKLDTVEPLYCAGGESITDRTWVDDYENVVGRCDHCETLQTCYADGERYRLNDHMSTPLGHKCSECDGPIWVEDNYMCALCIEAMT